MSGTKRRVSWLALTMALVAIGVSLTFLAHEIGSLPLTRTAEALEGANGVPRIGEGSRPAIETALERRSGCARRPVRARVATSLFLLQRSVSDGEPLDARLRRFETADRVVRDALDCGPMDGSLWATLAYLELLAAFEPERDKALMALSMRLAPFEGDALAIRWDANALAPDLARRLTQAPYRRDLCHLLAGAQPLRAFERITALDRPDTHDALAQIVAAVPPDRRAAIVAALRKAAGRNPPSEGPAATGSPLMALLADPREGDASVCGFTGDRMLPRAPLRAFRP